MIRLIALFLLLTVPAKAEEIVLGLSQDEVAITATFDGSEILIFGAIKRNEPVPDEGVLGVIVTVAGPDLPITCLLYTSPSPRDGLLSRMPSSA